MKTISEKGQDHGSSGGYRTSAYLTETTEKACGGGGTNSMTIIQEEECNSWSSSSIGEDSDGDHQGDAESRNEIDHRNNNGSFDDAIEALEKALPIRRGISTFYNGKSKSFTSLSDVWPSSIQDIPKPENAYTRKRRNLGAFKLSNANSGRISKKPKTRTTTLSSRSFSMVNLHRCTSTKIGNHKPQLLS